MAHPILRPMRASGTSHATTDRTERSAWAGLRERLRAGGLRWTPQRRVLVEVLSQSNGHVTGAELVERCRTLDPATTPSTVYRTLDVLEAWGIVRHAHGVDGREEFHVLPGAEHGHLHCRGCRQTWEIDAVEAAALVGALSADRGFEVDLSHLSVSGLCRNCAAPGEAEAPSGSYSGVGTPRMLNPPST
ncbi:MAG: Fur family transcriptional regulator [Chloroflexota bacterium]|nr:Fur family transcriptional regulator [Chloroflexota bacterium]